MALKKRSVTTVSTQMIKITSFDAGHRVIFDMMFKLVDSSVFQGET